MAPPRGEDAIIIDGLISDINRKVSNDSLVMPTHASIFKIPSILFRHNEKAYSPNAFSFGPFHHNTDNLKPTEKIKWKYFLDLISRSPNQNRDSIFRTLIECIWNVRKEALEHYTGPIGMSTKEFVEVLVFDGCFIIELFLKKEELKICPTRYRNDPVFSMSCLLQFLYHDLILLENQIPLLVLQTLFNLTNISSEKTLVQLAIEFFANSFSIEPLSIEMRLLECRRSKHILDLLRNSLLLSYSTEGKEKFSWQRMPSATSLEEAGIKFKKRESKSILDIQFNKGVLEIPPLLIQETTETLFRNLICLEQCCLNYDHIITSYAVLLDNLINTNSDMELLCRDGILVNWLDIEHATRFFNKLYEDTHVKEIYYFPVTSKVNNYCKRRWPRIRTNLKHEYFKHPWAPLSFAAATTLLILTFLQTVFAIIK